MRQIAMMTLTIIAVSRKPGRSVTTAFAPDVTTVFGGDPEARYTDVRLRRAERSTETVVPLPPFPNGWMGVAFAADLEVGGVLPVRVAGRDLVVFRGEDGGVGALDAYCPHLGAHLGVGGTVVDNTIECPFHAWRWAADGSCAAIPYAKRIPPKAVIRSYEVRDRNGFIFVWIHAQDASPTWEIEVIPEVDDAEYRITSRWVTPMTGHIQDVIENGVDLPHFRTVHKWEARSIDWQQHGHSYTMEYENDTTRGGEVEVLFQSQTEGPSFSRTRFWGAFKGVSMHCIVPIDDGILELRQLYVYHRDLPDEAAALAAKGSSHEWAVDVPIWENKRHLVRPVLVGDDGPVPTFRRWFAQFYSDDVVVEGADEYDRDLVAGDDDTVVIGAAAKQRDAR